MDPRTVRIFGATFLLTFCLLAGGWFALDVLLNLDEILEDSGPNSPLFREAVRHYSGVIRLQGPMLLGATALASAAAAFIETRRKKTIRPGSTD